MKRTSTILVVFLTSFAMLGLGACSSSDEDSSKSEGDKKSQDRDKDSEGSDKSKSADDKAASSAVGKTPSLSGDSAAYADAMVASMTADSDMPFTDEQARCYANRTVDVIGADRITAAGGKVGSGTDIDALDFSKLSVSEADGNKIYDQFEACGIDLRDAMIKSFAEGGEMAPEATECFETVLTEKNLRTLMVSTMINGEDSFESDSAGSELFSQLMSCSLLGMDESSFATDE